jgi:hypothetical protein
MNYAKTSDTKFNENPFHACLRRKENIKGKKGKVHPKTGHEDQEVEYMLTLLFV